MYLKNIIRGGFIMKKVFLLFAIFFVVCLFGCTSSLDNGTSNNLNEEIVNDLNIESEMPDHVQMLHVDYPVYSDANDLVNASTNIYTGTVKDISFEIIDYKTGKVDASSKSQSNHRMLYTIYTISLTNSIKGENPSEIKICRIGGILGYKEAEQYSKQESAGLVSEYKSLPLVDNCATLDIGKEYLFCTSRHSGDFDFVINLTQFVHHTDSHNATLISNLCKTELSAEKGVSEENESGFGDY